MKVCSQGIKISQMLLDIVGAKGMEQDYLYGIIHPRRRMMPSSGRHHPR
jgi:hypothetical protein